MVSSDLSFSDRSILLITSRSIPNELLMLITGAVIYEPSLNLNRRSKSLTHRAARDARKSGAGGHAACMYPPRPARAARGARGSGAGGHAACLRPPRPAREARGARGSGAGGLRSLHACASAASADGARREKEWSRGTRSLLAPSAASAGGARREKEWSNLIYLVVA